MQKKQEWVPGVQLCWTATVGKGPWQTNPIIPVKTQYQEITMDSTCPSENPFLVHLVHSNLMKPLKIWTLLLIGSKEARHFSPCRAQRRAIFRYNPHTEILGWIYDEIFTLGWSTAPKSVFLGLHTLSRRVRMGVWLYQVCMNERIPGRGCHSYYWVNTESTISFIKTGLARIKLRKRPKDEGNGILSEFF